MPSLIKLNVPSSWNRMGFCEKAGYLCSTFQAKNYSEACSMLARRRKVKPTVPAQPIKARLPYAD